MDKIGILVLVLFALATEVQAADCYALRGKYKIEGQYWGSDIQVRWGATKIQDSLKGIDDACIYKLNSKVEIYADPVKSGIQYLLISKRPEPIGNYRRAVIVDENNQKTDAGLFTPTGKGFILRVPHTGCGGQLPYPVPCGTDLIFKSSK